MKDLSIPSEFRRFPKQWKVMPFLEVISDETGGNPKILTSDYQDSGTLPVIDQGNSAISGYVDDVSLLCKAKLPCILFGDHTKNFKFVDHPFALGADGVKVLVPTDDLNSKFAYHYLKQVRLPDNAGYSRHFKFLKETYIPLPPLPEQKRIAAILDKADSIRRKRQEAVRLTEELLRSVFLEKFGDPLANPNGWETRSFEELLEIPLRNGLSPSTGGQYPGKVLTLSAITGNYFEASAVKAAFFSQDLPSDKFVNPRDFLICRGNGNANLVGKGKFPLNEIENTLFPDTMIAARIEQGKVVPEFLEMLWHTQLVRDQIDKGARTTNGTYKVNQGVLNAVKIICPPIEIQNSFLDIAKSVVRSQIKNSTSLVYSETLFNSLIQSAFNGGV